MLMHAMKECYEEITLFGQQVMFTPIRIDNKTVPNNLYKYEVRDDEYGNICEIARGILVNHWGTVISNQPIKLNKNGYEYIDEDKDITFSSGNCHTIKEYLEKYPVKTKQKVHER